MKLWMKLSLAILLPVFIGLIAFAQDADSNRNVNPGEDPNLEMIPQGQGVANIGCYEPSGACYKRLSHVRINKNTVPKIDKGAAPKPSQNGTSGGRAAEGTR